MRALRNLNLKHPAWLCPRCKNQDYSVVGWAFPTKKCNNCGYLGNFVIYREEKKKKSH